MNPETITRVKELLEQGKSRTSIEFDTNLSETQVYKLVSQIKAEDLAQEAPWVITQAKELIEKGKNKFQIRMALGLSQEQSDVLVAQAQREIEDEETKLEDEPYQKKFQMRRFNQEEGEKLLDAVSRLMSEGLGRVKIEKITGLTGGEVWHLMSEVRARGFQSSRPVSKAEKTDKVTRILEDGGSLFQLSRALDAPPGTTQRLVKRVQGQLSIPDELLKQALAKNPTLIYLMNRFGIKGKDEAVQTIKELFPNHLLYQKDLPDGDIRFVLIQDGSNHFEWLNSNTNSKDFKFKISDQNNYMYVQFDESLTDVTIYNFTDIHVGHKNFDRQRFLAYIELVKNDPKAFFVLGGDIFEWAHKQSVGDPWEQVLSPMEQVSESARLLMPIAHKCLGYRSGNHDKGRGRLVGADLAEVLAHYLKVPYFKVETFIHLQVGQDLYSAVLDHGHSGGSIQAILKDAEKYKESLANEVHFHLSGHVHNAQIIERIIKVVEPGVGLSMKRAYTVIGGSCLGYTGTYAEEAKYTPTPQDLTFIQLSDDGTYGAGKIPSNGS